MADSLCLYRVWPPNRQVTEHRAHEPGCWGEGGSHWKARQPESAGKLEAESQPTSWSVIWTLLNQGPQMDAGLRWWPPCDGSPHRGAENLDGVVLVRARRRKERTYPELVGLRRRARLGIEVGGRMSIETTSFLSQLAKARSRQETALMRRRVEQAWRMRGGHSGLRYGQGVAMLNLCTAHGADGDTPPVHEVEGDHRYAGLVP